MGYLIAFIGFLLVVLVSIFSSTVAGIGQAELIGSKWELVHTGWRAVFGLIGCGILIGLALGLVAGLFFWSRVGELLSESQDAELVRLKDAAATELHKLQEERATIQRTRLEMGDRLQTAIQAGAVSAGERVQAAKKAEQDARVFARKLERRLRNAQGKAMRLSRQKGKLMSCQAAKPVDSGLSHVKSFP